MAAYSFLIDKVRDQVFVERCAAAALVLADEIVNDGAATADDKAWAQQTFADPIPAGARVAAVVVGANSGATEAQIDNGNDATIQANVDAARSVITFGAAAV